MKKYTRRRQTRSKKYSRRCSRRGGGSRRPSAIPSARQSARRSAPPSATPSAIQSSRQSSRMKTPSRTPSGRTSSSKSATSKGVVVSRSRGHSHVNTSSRAPLRTAGISKTDTQALQAARLIANFPHNMDKFLNMVINNYKLLNYEGVKLALREQISINDDPAVGRLSRNGIIFISYICGILLCLLNELSTIAKTDVSKKIEILDKIKQIEKVICLLDGVGCSWGIRPYNKAEMDIIADYYGKIKDDAGLQEYHQQLNEFIDKYFPVLKKYTDPSHVVSSSMCIRLIPGHVRHVMSRLSTIKEE